MIEFGILLAVVVVLAVVIDFFSAFEITAFSVAMFRRGDKITDLRGGHYKVVGYYFDRDVLRVRRTLRRG